MITKINKIGIKNFKSFKDYVEIDLKNITVLSGLNSSGKSSIYQVILLLAQSEESYLFDQNSNKIPTLKVNGDYVNLGIADELLNDTSMREFSVVLEWEDNSLISICANFRLIKHKSYEKKTIFILSKLSLHVNGENRLNVILTDGKWKIEAFKFLNFYNISIPSILTEHIENNLINSERNDLIKDNKFYYREMVVFENVESIDFQNLSLEKFDIRLDEIIGCIDETYIKYVNIDELISEIREKTDDKEKTQLVNASRHITQKYKIEKNDIVYLPPFRGYPRRVYTNYDENRLEAAGFLADVVVDYYYDIETKNVKSGGLKEALNYWIVDHFELADEIEINEPIPDLISEIYLVMNGKKIPINNVGFGTSQIIPVVFNVLQNFGNKLFVIDEPEIHLHPSAQSKFADFFFNMAMIGKRIFIETHSEYIIDNLIYLKLSHEEIFPDIKMFWVKKNDEKSVIEDIEFDDLGFIVNSPLGFLSEKILLAEKLNKIRLEKI